MSKVDVANRWLRGRGLTLVPDWKMPTLPMEQHLRKLIAQYEITCVLDVGANLGQFRDLVVGLGWKGPVVSFEPVRAYFETIAPRASATWRIHDVALGNEEAVKDITIFDSPGLASLREPDIPSMEALLPRHAVAVTARESIRIRKLANFFAQATAGLDVSRVLLKIDTQGYDLDVIRGAAGVLGCVQVLQTELSFLPIYQQMPDFTEVVKEVRGLGFDVSGMFPVTHDDRARAVEMDCVFVRG